MLRRWPQREYSTLRLVKSVACECKFENDKFRLKTKDLPEVPINVETKNYVSNSEAQWYSAFRIR